MWRPYNLPMRRRSDRIPPRGYSDRRGMGAQSDFIAEKFVPSEKYKADQLAMVEKLIASGMSAEEATRLFAVPSDLLPAKPSTK
jgi:hypothetical protein